jgi:hypothetical protein
MTIKEGSKLIITGEVSTIRDPKKRRVDVFLKCPECDLMKSLGEFGIREMANGELRNQPRCNQCR